MGKPGASLMVAGLAVMVVLGVAGCFVLLRSPTPPKSSSVVLVSISPSSGPLGTEVVIRGSGFTSANNDVAFTSPKINFQGSNTAYLNPLPSPDGEMLRSTIPDNDDVLLGACPLSQLEPTEACPDIGILLPTGEITMFVINEKGKSNSVTFTVSGPGVAPLASR